MYNDRDRTVRSDQGQGHKFVNGSILITVNFKPEEITVYGAACPESVMPRSAIIDPVTFTANRTGSTRSRWRTNSDRVLPNGHVGGLTVGRLDSSRSRSISGPN